ncbi:hypothetical protein [Jeongeupia sp. HS-3]|uniref:hypothetical protein n=1 Tax=Jeongeupia sp. HS-3 TaxID=1009682 RepID=UPI001910C11F|nr:hypothetical protein [Jeongeupia sp. HS-3]
MKPFDDRHVGKRLGKKALSLQSLAPHAFALPPYSHASLRQIKIGIIHDGRALRRFATFKTASFPRVRMKVAGECPPRQAARRVGPPKK